MAQEVAVHEEELQRCGAEWEARLEEAAAASEERLRDAARREGKLCAALEGAQREAQGEVAQL